MKKIFILFVFIILSLAKQSHSQSFGFHKVYFYSVYHSTILGSYSGNSLAQTGDNGFIIGGSDTSALMLFKIDSHGDTLWVKLYGGSGGSQECLSVKTTPDGGAILVGHTNSPILSSGGDDMWIIKTDSVGDTLWSKSYGTVANDEVGYNIISTNDKGYIAVGRTGLGFNGNIYLVKTDSVGNLLWTKTLGTFNTNYPNSDTAYSAYDIRQTKDSSYIISGTQEVVVNLQTNFPDYYFNPFVIKISSQGNLLWAKQYITVSNTFNSITSVDTVGNNFIIGGGINEGLLMKIDSIGNIIWKRGLGYDAINSVRSTKDNGFICFCAESSYNGAGQVIKTNSFGLPIWTTMRSESGAVTSNIIETRDGGYTFLGGGPTMITRLSSQNNVFPPQQQPAVTFSKLDSAGNTQCSNSFSPNIDSTFQLSVLNLPLSVSSIGAMKITRPYVIKTYFMLDDTLCLSTLGSVNELRNGADILISPNPTNGIFTIQFSDPSTLLRVANIEIINVLGEKIYSSVQQFNNSTIDISVQPSGIYFLQLKTSEGVVNKKIIFQK